MALLASLSDRDVAVITSFLERAADLQLSRAEERREQLERGKRRSA